MPEKIDFECAASTASTIITEGTGLFLIKRKRDPFKGSWALPGGFHVTLRESLEEAAVREIREETSLIVKVEDLRLVCVHSKPDRDPRGHVIDHVYVTTKYKGRVKAKSDAEKIGFYVFSDLPDLAFDHKDAINAFLNQ